MIESIIEIVGGIELHNLKFKIDLEVFKHHLEEHTCKQLRHPLECYIKKFI
jgi:hypothetical protein